MTDRAPLYAQIAATIRQEILQGALRPGDPVPPVRDLASDWRCTPGTVQRAYRELVEQGLLVSRPGRGTFVALVPESSREQPLRWASLVHRAEHFLLEAMAAGFTPDDVERGLHLALDRWRAVVNAPPAAPARTLRFAGSHDMALNFLADAYAQLNPGEQMELSFVGSLGGLMSLEQSEVEIAGAHLWDADSDSYNDSFVRRLLPGEPVILLTVAHRSMGLIVPPGNPRNVAGIADLARDGIRLVTRQRGAGTRVWLEAMAQRAGLELAPVLEQPTQTDVARAIAEGRADVGPGIEAAARAYALDFVFVTRERYDLVMRQEVWNRPTVQRLAAWLSSSEAKRTIATLEGYDSSESGTVHRMQ